MSKKYYAAVEIEVGTITVQSLFSSNDLVPGIITIEMHPFMSIDVNAICEALRADKCLTAAEQESLYTAGNEIMIKISTSVKELVNRLIDDAEKDGGKVSRFIPLTK